MALAVLQCSPVMLNLCFTQMWMCLWESRARSRCDR